MKPAPYDAAFAAPAATPSLRASSADSPASSDQRNAPTKESPEPTALTKSISGEWASQADPANAQIAPSLPRVTATISQPPRQKATASRPISSAVSGVRPSRYE